MTCLQRILGIFHQLFKIMKVASEYMSTSNNFVPDLGKKVKKIKHTI